MTDTVTGLMWLKQAGDIHENGVLELTQNASELKDTVPHELANAFCQTLVFPEPPNDLPGWRLPTIRELMTIIDYGRFNPAVDLMFFDMPQTGAGAILNIFWSATGIFIPDPPNPLTGNVFCIRFGPGHMNFNDMHELSEWTRCVRSIQTQPPPPSPSGYPFACGDANGNGILDISDAIFILNYLFKAGSAPCVVGKEFYLDEAFQVADLTILGLTSGLEWEKTPSPGLFTWEEALASAKDSNLAGHNDWRLPNVTELGSLLEFLGSNGSFLSDDIQPPGAPFPGEDPEICLDQCKVFWTSTTFAGLACEAWKVHFGADGLLVHNRGSGNNKGPGVLCREPDGTPVPHQPARVWLVRGGIVTP